MEVENENKLPTLAEVEREFLNGRSYGWSRRSISEYHKVSATSEWYKYRNYLLEYPGTLKDEDVNWCIKTIGCGKRHRSDTLLLYRIVPLDYVREKSYNFSWTSRFARDEENDCFYEISRIEARFFLEEGASTYDKHFAAWHRDSMMKAHGLVKERKVTEEMCPKGCRPSYCYCKRECDDKNLKYEINEHSMEVEVTVGFRTISLTLDEAAELASFLATAKEEIKKKKIAALEAQQDELKKQLESVKGM